MGVEREKNELYTQEEQTRLEIIQKGIDYKKNKEDYPDVTWDILNDSLNKPYANGESFRSAVKAFQRTLRSPEGDSHEDALPYASTDEDKLRELLKERIKVRDERLQYNEYVRKVSRQETFQEIALECANVMAKSKPFLKPTTPIVIGENRSVSMISDWHLGLDFENGINKYNSDIAKQRISELLAKTIEINTFHNVSKIYVVNLQDLISGWIRPVIRLENRENLIQQIMMASEIVAEYLQSLSNKFEVEYYSTLDNHSRLDPDKKNALKLENFALIMNWYLKSRLSNNSRIRINDNEFSEDVVIFNVFSHNFVAVHGDIDKPSDAVSNLTLLTKKFYQVCLTAHYHHFACDEDNDTVIVSNGSLVGVDNYSESLRKTSRPTQNIIIVTKENPVLAIYPIPLS